MVSGHAGVGHVVVPREFTVPVMEGVRQGWHVRQGDVDKKGEQQAKRKCRKDETTNNNPGDWSLCGQCRNDS